MSPAGFLASSQTSIQWIEFTIITIILWLGKTNKSLFLYLPSLLLQSTTSTPSSIILYPFLYSPLSNSFYTSLIILFSVLCSLYPAPSIPSSLILYSVVHSSISNDFYSIPSTIILYLVPNSPLSYFFNTLLYNPFLCFMLSSILLVLYLPLSSSTRFCTLLYSILYYFFHALHCKPLLDSELSSIQLLYTYLLFHTLFCHPILPSAPLFLLPSFFCGFPHYHEHLLLAYPHLPMVFLLPLIASYSHLSDQFS